ncbi:MAG: exopolyphosphatase [Bacteroidota bacterium]
MNKTPFAVIDLGTNTFHLLVAQEQKKGFEILYRERIFVKLGEQGIETLGQVPFERGILAMKHFSEVVQQFRVRKVRAIGTAALRTASNGIAFLERVKAEAAIDIQIITGEEEAALIHKGVALAVPILEQERVLIMDIGGGSVEFIIADAKQVFWANSFPVGVSVLFKQFHKSDPISASEIRDLRTFLKKTFLPLDDALTQFPIQSMIGASGTFDVMEDNLPILESQAAYSIIDLQKYKFFQNSVVESTHAERLQMPEIPRERADLIVVALLLVEIILEKLNVAQLSVSHFAMKEGILQEMMKMD